MPKAEIHIVTIQIRRICFMILLKKEALDNEKACGLFFTWIATLYDSASGMNRYALISSYCFSYFLY